MSKDIYNRTYDLLQEILELTLGDSNDLNRVRTVNAELNDIKERFPEIYQAVQQASFEERSAL